MKGINVSRWLLGGLVGGIVIWVFEGAASTLYMADMQAAMTAHNLKMEMSAAAFAISVFVSLVSGLAIVFFYVAARPRFGPGPATAVLVASVFWAGGYLLTLFGYQMMGLFPTGLLVQWGVVGLVEMIVGGTVGAWLYREP